MTEKIDLINPKFLKKGKYQKKITTEITQCLACERKCQIGRNKSGFCQTRINFNGDIFSVVYGLIPALSFNPIEKKPLYHFHPGTIAVTIGTYGCNFSCWWCQNYHISKKNPLDSEQLESSKFLSPERLIEIALMNGCQGTSISFNEPTLLFEYSLEVFKLAKKKGLYNTYVTNGYMTEEVLRDLVDSGLDAMNIDIKGDADMVQKHCGVDIERVWRNAILAKELGVHVEITTLLINQLNTSDSTIRDISNRIFYELGENTPYHLSRFFPQYKSADHGFNNPTPLNDLKKAYKIAKDVGLSFVYLGNIPSTDYDKTTCPNCSKIAIEREVFGIRKINLDLKGNCKYCGFPISIV